MSLLDLSTEISKYKFHISARLFKNRKTMWYRFASEHIRTLYFSCALKTLKKTGVYSSSFCEASVKNPNGPSPPLTVDPIKSQISRASK